MTDLTTKQRRVLTVLVDEGGGDYMTPSLIGECCGLDYERASSWAAGALKALRSKGLATRGEGSTAGMWAATDEALAG